MEYDIFHFGLLNVAGHAQKVPAQNEYIPRYDEKSAISFESACNDEPITWIKPNGLSILVTDRVLLSNVSLDDLDKNHFVRGKTVTMNGQKFRCRVLRYDYEDESSDEWANILSITGKDDSLWHWNKMYFWRQINPLMTLYMVRFADVFHLPFGPITIFPGEKWTLVSVPSLSLWAPVRLSLNTNWTAWTSN